MKGSIPEKAYFDVQTVQIAIPPRQQWTHRQIHQGQVFTCDKCPFFKTDTEPNLRQHISGKHGKGWCSPCGQRFSWPPKMFRHRKKCTVCKNIKVKTDKQAEKLANKLSKK